MNQLELYRLIKQCIVDQTDEDDAELLANMLENLARMASEKASQLNIDG